MAEPARFTPDTNVSVCFWDPHNAWHQGSNENGNRLLRQYFPKGANFGDITPDHLDAVADSLNR